MRTISVLSLLSHSPGWSLLRAKVPGLPVLSLLSSLPEQICVPSPRTSHCAGPRGHKEKALSSPLKSLQLNEVHSHEPKITLQQDEI